MDIQQTLLLPSQEALVQRLQHIASYSEQLVLVSGVKGSGKTTLVTALASELDNYNSALVICPMHADSAEIRRKILVQIISSPIFDDALPLSDTLLRIQSSLTKPLHIIIDDAHLLPKELWAECLVLTQIQCAGKPVSLTFTIATERFAELTELTTTTKDMLLNVEIEPLSLTEREGLYQTLLVRSNKSPFIPREIIQVQIGKQSGTPAEVVALLKVALDEKVIPKKRWSKLLIGALISLVLIITVGLSWLVYDMPAETSSDTSQSFTAMYVAPNSEAQWFNFHFAQNVLQSWLKNNSYYLDIATRPDESQLLELIEASQLVSMPLELTPSIETSDFDLQMLESESIFQAEVELNYNVHTDDIGETLNIIETDKLHQDINDVVTDSADNADVSANHQVEPLLERSGYTLQLASVNSQESLETILLKLQNEPQLIQAKHNNRFIILLGQFEDINQAQNKASALQNEFGFSAPWVRKFSDLKGYVLSLN